MQPCCSAPLARLVPASALPFLLAALLAADASAQIASFVGPEKVPLGAGVAVGLTNLTDEVIGVSVAPYDVVGPSGPVDLGLITLLGVATPPGQTYLAIWDQTDHAGQQVPPGAYTVNVHVPGGSKVPHSIEIGLFEAAVALTAAPILGSAIGFRLEAPGDGGLPYVMMASASATLGIPTCAGSFPLDPDLLWVMSLIQPEVFSGWSGVLGADGVADDATLGLPMNPAFAGWSFQVAFVTIDPASPCAIASISEATTIVIQ